jgi:hypothetical protein
MSRNPNVQDNTAVLFKNPNYTPENNQPYYKGEVVMDGTQRNLSMWIREASGDGKMEAGTKFLSGKLDDWQPKQQKPKQDYQPTQSYSSQDIPF